MGINSPLPINEQQEPQDESSSLGPWENWINLSKIKIMYWKRTWKRKSNFLSSRFGKVDKSKLMARVSFFGMVFVVVGALVAILAFTIVARELPAPDKVVRREGFSTKITDRNGQVLYDLYANQKRIPIKIDQVPQDLRDATVAIEDKNFYKHEGFDPTGWIRSIYRVIFFRKQLAGGSTLTQQLVKNVLLTPERSIWRKVKEFILSVQIERKFNKDEILQMYLNEAPYGGTAWGVEAASETYFDKSVSELNLIESAILAGLPQRPSVYSPFSSHPDAFKGRTTDVLRRMEEDGYITKDERDRALDEMESIKFASESGSIKAPHFVFYIKKQLEDRFGDRLVEQGGLTVTTSLDYGLQEKAQQAVTEEIAKVEKVHITNGAAVVIDPLSGEILAMVGSKDYNDPNYDGKVNVTTSRRQPGSAIKPVTYVTAFKEGYTPASMLMDVQTTFPGGANNPEYKPVNYDGKFHGPIQLRYALGNSLNIPAVKLLALVGIKDVLNTAFDMGLTTLEPTQENLSRLGLSMTLGGGEVTLLDMVSAYSAFSNGGKRVEPVSILKVVDRDGKVLEEHKSIDGKRVLDEQHAFLINSILSDNKAREATFGLNSLLNIPGKTIAVKTGTTNDRRDNWTIGWGSKSRIVGVWVGNNDNSAMKQVASGISGASPIWRRILLAALENFPDQKFEQPGGTLTLDVDAVSGFRAHDGFSTRTEFFVDGAEPNGDDQIHKKTKICKASGKLATALDIARGDYDEKEYFFFKENDPTGGLNGQNMWQKGIDEWLLTQSDPRYHPPLEFCSSSNEISIEIREPEDRSTINSAGSGSDVRIRVEPYTSAGISNIEIFVDGTNRANFGSRPYEVTVFLENGQHSIRAKLQDSSGRTTDREIRIGVNAPWEAPTPTTLQIATPTP